MKVLEAFLFLSFKVERGPVSQKGQEILHWRNLKKVFATAKSDFTTPRGSEGHS